MRWRRTSEGFSLDCIKKKLKMKIILKTKIYSVIFLKDIIDVKNKKIICYYFSLFYKLNLSNTNCF